MMTIRILTLVATVFAFTALSPAMAGDAANTGVSFQAKKQGKVFFKKQTPEGTESSSTASYVAADENAGTVADIEPAAGDETVNAVSTDEAISDSIRLPRK